MKKGLVSILIVNWNQQEFLDDCFKSIFYQTYKNYEVIVLDNASSDSSLETLKKYTRKKNFTLIESKENLGFAQGNNLAYKKVQGEYILLLNADTKFDKEVIDKLVDFFKTHKKAGVVQPKLVFMSDNKKLDNVGAYLTKTGIPYYFGLYKDADDPKYNSDLKVYSGKGACILIRRKVIEKTGFLDDYMFAYFEESDFCHRVWLSGYEFWYTPRAVVEHFVGATYKKRDNIDTVFKSHRNRIRSFIKNFELPTLLWLLPIHIFTLIGVTFVEVAKGNYEKGFAVLHAIGANLLNLNNTLRERKRIQSEIRKVPGSLVNQYIFKNPRLSYYRYVGGGLENYQD